MIVFTDYKYKGVGGVGQIVVNTVLELNRKGQTAKVYASHESYEYKRLVEEKAECILIDSETVGLKEFATRLDKEDVIFLTHINNNELLKEIKHINNRLIFYVVHPDTFFAESRIHSLFGYRQKVLNFINLLDTKKALYLMDRPNVNSIERRGLQLNYPIRYLPVPVKINVAARRSDTNIPSIKKITYIGRGNDDWKIYPVIKILQDLNGLEDCFNFVIFTDTDTRFRNLIKLHIPNNKINIEYKLGVYGQALNDYLVTNAWLHMSMGTAALDGAKLGIPTILVNYSKSLFPKDYVYNWLFESKEYSLGDEIFPDSEFSGQPLSAIVRMLGNRSNYNNISDHCYNYVKKHHSIESFADGLVKACEKSEMRVMDYCNSSFFHFFTDIYIYYQKLSKIKHSVLNKLSTK